MDQYLVDYLRSGRAWLLVGSGPSTAIGYPSWQTLAVRAIGLCRSEVVGVDLSKLEKALSDFNYPEVFEQAAALVGMPRLLQYLDKELIPDPSRSKWAKIYTHIARWPVDVYMTTNFDHEIGKHLSDVGESSYIPYSNSEDHMSALVPDLTGAVVHLHGDLRSESGLILTTTQYRDILNGPKWEYWRTKMTAVFQMNRVIVLGHSLSDTNVRHVLEAAKKGAGVVQPVCWIAPDVSNSAIRDYLEKYRIRVVTYDNRDRTHQNLVRLVESISDFVPPRIAVRVSSPVAKTSQSPLGGNAAAPGFFVFTKLSANTEWEKRRIDIVVAALRSAVPRLVGSASFSLQKALEIVGWPPSLQLTPEFEKTILEQAISNGLFVKNGTLLSVGSGAEQSVRSENERFTRLRQRFQLSLSNRLRREFPMLSGQEASTLAVDIDAALAGYFRDGGLTLASTLIATSQSIPVPSAIPSSILRFLTEASARYDNHLFRQAFSTVSLHAFIRADAIEREYLGRISQGFFAFHLLGVFGDAALERMKHAKDTVWLLDSSVQISILAVGSESHVAFREICRSLSGLGIRFFTTERLFDETREHLWFANKVVSDAGPRSAHVIAAARGDAPYRKGNLFLGGFINWQAAGNPADWDQYLIAAVGAANVYPDTVRSALKKISVEVIEFQDWPGFVSGDFAEKEDYVQRVITARDPSGDSEEELRDKATPEAEAAVVVLHERDGHFHMLSAEGDKSPAWFVSQTAILNTISNGQRITWQPEAFMRFAATLAPAADQEAADRAFETLLWSLAQSGVVVLDDRIATNVFGGIIDQARLVIGEQRAAYEKSLGEKYGEPIEKVLERVAPLQQPLAALQLANELAAKEAQLREVAQVTAAEANKRAKAAESELAELQKYRQKLREKQKKAEQRKRKGQSKPKRKRR
jgi:hypothetical protein